MDRLAESWHCAYEPEGYSQGVAAALADMEATFAGEYGRLWLAASLVAEAANGTLASIVQVVTHAPWPDVPDSPFIIEAFTRPEYRRSGLARTLLIHSLRVAAEAEHDAVGLRVMSENKAALAMYESLDFA
jgi:ribosomal protein S18 acetylase RimI-like enzyme